MSRLSAHTEHPMLDMPSASGSDDQRADSISSDGKNKPQPKTRRSEQNHPLDVLAGWNQLKDWADADRINEMMRQLPN